MKRSYFLKVIIIPSVIYFLMAVFYTLFTSYDERERIIAEVDRRLVIAASNIKTVLDTNFFDRATDSGKISNAEHF